MAAPTTRKVVFSNPKGTLIKGEVTPNYGTKKIKAQKKVGKKWKAYKTFETTQAGRYHFRLPPPGSAPRQDAVEDLGPRELAVHDVADHGLHLQLPPDGGSEGCLHPLTPTR